MPSPRRSSRLASFLLLALLLAPWGAAEIVTVGEPFVLAPDSAEVVGSVDVAWLPPGAVADRPEGFVLAWRGRRDLDTSIYRAFVPADPALPELPAMRVAGPGRLLEPHLAAGLDRRSAVVFASSPQEHPDCFAGVLYDADLAPQASLDPAEPCHRPFLDAALLTDGHLVVVYEIQRSQLAIKLWGQRFGRDGQPLEEPFEASERGANNLERVRVVAPAGTGFLVLSVYQSQNRFDPEGPSSLWASRFGADGERLAPPIQLAESERLIYDVSLVPTSGGFVAVWVESALTQGDPIQRIIRWFGRRLAATGAPAGPVQPLLADVDLRSLRSVHAARGPGDTVLLGWTADTGAGLEFQAQLFTADLAAAGDRATLVTGTGLAALAASPAGDALAVWHSDGALLAQRLIVEGECTPSETVLCLQGGRFEVSVEWADFQGNSGPGRRVPVASDDSGLFWFFHPENWEMLVKVLDACPLDGHFWVFAAAATNVEYTLTVNDLVAHQTRIFRNDLGDTARALTVTDAFPTCGASEGEGGGGG